MKSCRSRKQFNAGRYAGNTIFLLAFLICLCFLDQPLLPQHLKIPAGSTFNLNTGRLVLPGDLEIGGAFGATTGTVSIGGSWNCTGVYNCGTSMVTLRGTGIQQITTGGHPFFDLTVSNSSAAGVSFQDGFATEDFTAVTPGTSMKFMQGQTFTISNNLTLSGLPGNEVKLDSIDGLNRFTLNITKGPETVSEVEVMNSQTIGNSITASNSIKWSNTDFGEGEPSWIFAAAIRYWVGPVAGNWLDINNWSATSGGPGGVPAPSKPDKAIFDSGSSGGGPRLETDIELTDLILESGYTGQVLSDAHDIRALGEVVVKSGGLIMGDSTGLTVEGTVNISGGQLDAKGSTSSIQGDLQITSGQFIAPAGALLLSGDIQNSGGQFIHSDGTVNLLGGGVSVVSGNNDFNNLVCQVPGKTIRFGAGNTQTISGVFDFKGIQANPVALRSTVEGSPWNISFTNAQRASFLDVKDSNALVNEVRVYNSKDSGNNNENWKFAGSIAIVTPYSNRTVGNTITFRGSAGPDDTVVIKTSTGVAVATIKADSNGNFRGNSDPALAAGVYDFVPWVGGISGDGVASITVVDTPTTEQVPVIQAPEENTRIIGGQPLVQGMGKPGMMVTLTARDADGNLLLTDVAAATVDSGGRFSITLENYYEKLVRGTNYLTVSIDGVTSAVVGINLIDPYGIVFDSVTNEPVEGATVTLYTSDGTVCVPGVHIAAADLNPQVTKADGFYEYMVAPGDYYIRVNSSDYSYPSSKATLPAGRVIVNGSRGEMFSVIKDIIEMDHPVDMSPFLKIEKTVNRREVSVGDIATYTVSIENTSSPGQPNSRDAVNIRLKDTIPPGFKYIPGRSRLDEAELNDPDGPRPLYFDVGTIAAGQKRELKYQLVVGTGVIPGDYQNSAVAVAGNDLAVSNIAVRSVRVVHDPLFHLGTVIGKVFHDRNKNGYQDKGEPVIEGVTLVTEEGTVIRTGKDGKYHLPALLPGRHAIRLDERSLPAGGYTTTPATVIVDITDGILRKVNFGVGLIEEGEKVPMAVSLKKDISEKRLNVVLLTGGLEFYGDKPVQVPEFRIFTNYSLFISRWQLDILPEGMDMVVRSFKGTGLDIHAPIEWNGLDRWGNPLRPEFSYVYRLKVWDHGNSMDRTVDRMFKVSISSGTRPVDPGISRRVFRNEMLSDGLDKGKSSIQVRGSVMRIDQLDLSRGNLSVYRGKAKVGDLNVNANNRELLNDVGVEMILPEGRYRIEAEGEKEVAGTDVASIETMKYTQELNVAKEDFIFVAMFDASGGQNSFEGFLEPLQNDRRYRDTYWKDGRAAFYLKGKVKGKYLVTSSYDSERSRRDLFRRLDPDQYYPVYGDSSSISYDATNTQGKLYLLVEWDKSKALFGNFTADLGGSKLAPYSRAFYGGKLDYQSVATSPWGEPLTRIVIYQATQNQRAAHNEFIATGGSLYFLRHRNLIGGSLRVSVEVRDKLTGLVISRKPQVEDMDYQVDYGNGRLLFFHPVTSRIQSNILTTNQLLDGNPVYVIADYEFDDLYSFKEGSAGGRIEQGVGEYLEVGSSFVREEQGDQDYELKEADATLRFGKRAAIRGEYAETTSSAMDMFLSDDGGLSFSPVSSRDDASGRAFLIEGNVIIGSKGLISAYHQNTGAGFSTSSTISQQGKKATGMSLTYQFDAMLNLSLRHDIQEMVSNANTIAAAQIGASRSTTSIIQVGGKKGRITYAGEYRRQEVTSPLSGISSEANRPQELFAVQLDYKISEQYSAFLKQQGRISGIGESLTSVGMNAQFDEKTSLKLVHTRTGSDSTATSVDLGLSPYDWLQLTGNATRTDHRLKALSNDSISLGATGKVYDGLQLRTTYALQRSGDGISRDGVSVGSAYQITPDAMLTLDRAWMSGSGDKSISNIYGLSGKINEQLAGNISFEDGLVLRLDGTSSDRKAGAIGFTYASDLDSDGEKDLSASGKAEMRKDSSAAGESRHILLLGTLEGRLSENTTLFAKASIANAELPDQDTFEADYREYVLGIAYRPEFSDRLNLLTRYTYLKDNSPSGQADYTGLEEQKGHEFAFEAIYDFSPKLQLMEKFAYRLGEEKVAGFDFTESQTSLWINRLQYRFDENWSVATEYRILKNKQAADSKTGALLEIIRKIGEDFNIGAGYNFTDFNDDLTHLDYTVKGPFVRFTGVFTDQYFRPRARFKKSRVTTKETAEHLTTAPGRTESISGTGLKKSPDTISQPDEKEQILKNITDADDKIIEMLTAEMERKHAAPMSTEQILALAGQLVRNNELDEAVVQYHKAVEVIEKSGDRLLTADVYKQLGLVYQAKGDNQDALACFRTALVHLEKKFGGEHAAVAEVLSFIAFGYGKSGHDYLARSTIRHALRIMKQAYGPDDPRVAACINRLAWVHCCQGDYLAGFSAFKESMMVFEKAGMTSGIDYFSCLKGLKRLALMLDEKELYQALEQRISGIVQESPENLVTQ